VRAHKRSARQRPMVGGGGGASLPELLAVWRWSSAVLRTRLTRWWTGDVTLPLWCNASPYLFRPSRLPTPFEPAERYLPKLCNCTGVVGCKFPRGGNGRGRLELCRIPVPADAGP